ncbi:MAG TPA: sulfurtransferase [Burkholderiaceae bacterium]|jgi:thiosulfate/3-mercaptopyruvate sulfurtransferase|nr:sulfurtransferase [Burkholderiaceae bacterium]
MWTTLITAEELARAIDDCVVVDCRHDLFDTDAGRRAYLQSHIPGAFFLHMDEDLSGPKTGRNGRHPLPDRDALRARLAALGLSDARQLIAYDASGGQMAARLWWLARWLGHERVAVLDGDLSAWTAAGYPLSSQLPAPPAPGRLSERAPLASAFDAESVAAGLRDGTALVVDARAPERYEGKTEPIDPVAGHIPGAVNRFNRENLRPDGRFKPAPVLRAEFETLLRGRPPSQVVHQCGSGVAACHSLLAMEHAGLHGASLYAGSWSEWIADPQRPIATGPQP